jgi:hypothetical protein
MAFTASKKRTLTLTCALLALVPPLVANGATLEGWNTGNVSVGATPPDHETGASVVYDGDPADPASTSSGRIVFTAPEAESPGIKVQPEAYQDSGPGDLELSGCLMTSNPGATCSSPFQSGKRIKQQMTGFGPVDLVFDTAASDETSVYQVFHRLINVTGQSLAGFVVEIGSGVGDGFVAAAVGSAVRFSAAFTAQPTGSGPANTQFPFGLFGDAASNPNFSLDGFFEPERTGYEVALTDTTLSSLGFYGPYGSYFGDWLSRVDVPLGAFWDADSDPQTDDLLMAWETPEGLWEARRAIDANNDPYSLAEADWLTYATFDELVTNLFPGLSGMFAEGAIEDLANLNLNFAVELGSDFTGDSFTLRTTVVPAPVPLPATGLLLVAGMGLLTTLRRRAA